MILLELHALDADDTSAGDATELRWELNEDLGRCYVSFHVDQ